MGIVRDNLMTEKDYSPYCGGERCHIIPRTRFNGEQFECPYCKWVSRFPKEFIDGYKEKWDLK